MKHLGSRLLVASLGGLALILAAGENFLTPASAQMRTVATARSGGARAAFAHANLHHRRGRNNGGYVYWPDDYGYYGDAGVAPGQPGVEVAPPSGDVHYTYTYDAPWDAVHRLPPNVVAGPRPYVSDCTTQVVTVPRRGDSSQTANINVTRCY